MLSCAMSLQPRVYFSDSTFHKSITDRRKEARERLLIRVAAPAPFGAVFISFPPLELPIAQLSVNISVPSIRESAST